MSELIVQWPWRGVILSVVLLAAWFLGGRSADIWIILVGISVATIVCITNSPSLYEKIGLQDGPKLDDSTALLTLVLGILGLLGTYIAYFSMVNGARELLLEAVATKNKEGAQNHWIDWIAMTAGMVVVFVFVLFLLTWIETREANKDYRHLLRILWLGASCLFTINLYTIAADIKSIQTQLATLQPATGG